MPSITSNFNQITSALTEVAQSQGLNASKVEASLDRAQPIFNANVSPSEASAQSQDLLFTASIIYGKIDALKELKSTAQEIEATLSSLGNAESQIVEGLARTQAAIEESESDIVAHFKKFVPEIVQVAQIITQTTQKARMSDQDSRLQALQGQIEGQRAYLAIINKAIEKK